MYFWWEVLLQKINGFYPSIPSVSVNHMQAHILAHFIDEEDLKNLVFHF
jgi:tRNA A37 threonylcarbamoyltransferase TsaD